MSGREALRARTGLTSRDVGQRQAHLLWEQDIGGSSPLIPTWYRLRSAVGVLRVRVLVTQGFMTWQASHLPPMAG